MESSLFGFLFWALLLIGLWIAAMGHSGFYHFVTGRDGGDMDHPGSWGSF
ncbi:MAG: hypothetical protein R3C08_08050 [Hyphomonas sp.]